LTFVETNSFDPYFNLATEETLLTVAPQNESILLLWQNKPTVVVGVHQNAYEEIDRDYVERKGVLVARRLTGGGAVYHDLGNLNYTLTTPDNSTAARSLSEYFRGTSQPIVEVLRELGARAELSGRNDVLVDGKKVSGVAQLRRPGRVLCHGTLLFRSDLDELERALKVDPSKFRSKAVESVRARVGNICDYLPQDSKQNALERFRDALKRRLATKTRRLTDEELQAIQKLRDEKYATWDWNFGAAPKFQYRNAKRFDWGKFELAFDVEKGRLVRARIFGDFFAIGDVASITEALIDASFQREAFAKRVTQELLQETIPNLSQEEFLNVVFGRC